MPEDTSHKHDRRYLQIGADHNQLSNRTIGDPHPQYLTIFGATDVGQVLMYDPNTEPEKGGVWSTTFIGAHRFDLPDNWEMLIRPVNYNTATACEDTVVVFDSGHSNGDFAAFHLGNRNGLSGTVPGWHLAIGKNCQATGAWINVSDSDIGFGNGSHVYDVPLRLRSEYGSTLLQDRVLLQAIEMTNPNAGVTSQWTEMFGIKTVVSTYKKSGFDLNLMGAYRGVVVDASGTSGASGQDVRVFYAQVQGKVTGASGHPDRSWGLYAEDCGVKIKETISTAGLPAALVCESTGGLEVLRVDLKNETTTIKGTLNIDECPIVLNSSVGSCNPVTTIKGTDGVSFLTLEHAATDRYNLTIDAGGNVTTNVSLNLTTISAGAIKARTDTHQFNSNADSAAMSIDVSAAASPVTTWYGTTNPTWELQVGSGATGHRIRGDLVPETDNLYNIGRGTPLLRWKGLYYSYQVYRRGTNVLNEAFVIEGSDAVPPATKIMVVDTANEVAGYGDQPDPSGDFLQCVSTIASFNGTMGGGYASATQPYHCVTKGYLEAVDWDESNIDHNLIGNLTVGDVHTQYLLASGARALAGDWSAGGFNIANIGKVSIGNATVDGTYAALIKGNSALKVQSAAAADLATFDNTKILFGKDLDMDGNLLYSIGELKDVAKAAIGTATVDGSYALLVKSNTPLKLQDAAAAGSATFYVANTGKLYISSTDTYKRIYLCNTDFNILDDAATSVIQLTTTRTNGHMRFEAKSMLTFSINYNQSTYLTSSQFQIGVPTYFVINDASTSTVLEALRVQRGTSGTAAPGIGAQLNFQVEKADGAFATAGFWAAKWTDPVVATGLDSDIYMGCNSAGSYVYPLYVDGANQRVAIFHSGAITPQATLDVDGGMLADTYSLQSPLAAYTQTYSTASRTVNNPTALATFRPMGEMYLYDNSTATGITNSSTWTQVIITFTDGHLDSFDTPSSYELRYTGSTTTAFHLGCTVSLKAAAANQTIKAVLIKNATVDANWEYTGGTILNGGTIRTKTGGAGDEVSTAIHIMASLATNDTLSLFVQNTTSTNDITVIDCNLFGMGISQDLPDDIAGVKQNLNQVIDDLQTIDLLQ